MPQRRPARRAPRLALAALALPLALLAPAGAPALAHVTLDLATAPAESYVRLAIRVPHGCGAAATTGIRLQVPEGLTGVHPQPKPGWTLTILPGEPPAGPAGAAPAGEHAAGPMVHELAWRGGPLPSAYYEEFLLMVRTPAAAGETLWFPFIQECEGGAVTRWIERPTADTPRPRFPAYGLRLTPRP